MEIFTARLLLRDFRSNDWRDVLAYRNDPLYLRFYDWERLNENNVRAFVDMMIGWQIEQPRQRFQLAITLREGSPVIGNVGIRINDPRLREANIGYELDSNYWRRGYATEAARAMLTFGFESLKMHRVYAHCVAENEASWRVMERLGMTREGREREKEWIKNRWYDRLTYSILAHEWPARSAE